MAQKKLSICNPRPKKVPGPELLHQLVPEETKNGVAAIEYCSEDGIISQLKYDELHRRANALACRIRSILDRLDDRPTRIICPILLPQCLELYISQLASLKAGGAFCPIVLDAPEERLRFILRDTDARILLTTVALQPCLPELPGIDIIFVDNELSNQAESSAPVITIKPRDPAYIMYTSGSTGQPKGVVLSHSAATQALLAHDRHIPAFSRFLQFASPTFDVSVFEIFFPWYRHQTLVACDRRKMLNDLPAVMRELCVDACELTPSVASSLLRRRKNVPGLKVLLTIGEMLKPAVIQEFGGNADEPSILHGMYGPTEATIHCTLHTFFAKDETCGVIGLPLDTVSAFVVKPSDPDKTTSRPEILPVGEEGELAVGGHQLADGYLNRDEQSRAVFVHHPEFGTLYRTGDRARMSPDGVMECLGRISSGQVKLRGQRVELGEIEHAASKTMNCRDAVAEVISGNLVVFCAQEVASLTRDQVLKTCRQWLPSFMVPGDAIVLEALPYLASGKCDRKALRAQYQHTIDTNDDPTGSEVDDRTARIVRVVSRVLVAAITPSSFLPACGLDSLSSIRIASALQKEGLGQFDATQILAARSVLDIATSTPADHNITPRLSTSSSTSKTYEEELSEEIRTNLPGDSLGEVELAYPCTPVQVAMLAETSKTHDAYCNWLELSINCKSGADLMKEALRRLCSLHPLLRSGFVPATTSKIHYAVVQWKHVSAEQMSQVADFDYDFSIRTEQELRRPCRLQIKQCAEGYRILLQMHHAMFDQWSVDILQSDLSNILAGRDCTQSGSFQRVSQHYYAQAEEAQSAATFDFWQDHLRQATFTSLPLLRGTVVPRSVRRSQWLRTNLMTSEIKTASQKMKCSMPSIFQAALSYILGSYTGSGDVTFGSVFSGRTLPIADIESIFGPCLATLPCRIDHSSASNCTDLLRAITQQNRALQRHILTPPTSIKEAAGVLPGSALFDTLFLWQESTIDLSSAASAVRLVDSGDKTEYNLVLECLPFSGGTIQLRATFQDRLISLEQVNVFLRQVEALASQIVTSPDQKLDDLASCLSSDLLSISNPQPKCFAKGFELCRAIDDRAMSTPSAKAITFAHDLEECSPKISSISCQSLVSRANRMAHHFIASGLQPGSLVCICMEKSIDLYVSMLATFKAGAGYLPLVPDTPDGRMKSVFAQTNVQLCVGDQQSIVKLRKHVDVVVIDIENLDLTHSPLTAPAVRQDGSQIAYVVFTSGSTGEPKGVAVTMDNLKGNLAVLADLYNVQPGSRLLQSCSQAFDVSVFEIFFAFYQGMCLCSATKETMFSDFEQSIRAFGATHLSLTPTVAALVKPGNVPSVQFLVTAGEGITDRVHRIWADHGLNQGYGPSETTNICSVKMNVSRNDVLGNIGPPFKNTSAFVLEPGSGFRIASAGAYGEFAFGGEQVFQGYIGRDDLNSEKIIEHPEYGRIYRSGDMGRILHDGTLLISGRLDDQVKIRGNRVELGEINAMILRCSAIADCTTLMLGEKSFQQMLISFCVPVLQDSVSEESISIVRSEDSLIEQVYHDLESSLPAYMVPSFVLPITRLPITSQGKLDKRLLKTIFAQAEDRDRFARSREDGAEKEPASELEQILIEVLADILELDIAEISRSSSFFGLGLNSLNAIQLAKRLEKKLEAKVSIATILQNPSIARLSSILSQYLNKSTETKRLDVRSVIPADVQDEVSEQYAERRDSIEAMLPCTPLQQAMLSASQSRGREAYSNTTRLDFDGDLNKLRRCWDEVTKRHGILRTSFAGTTNAEHPYVQMVLKDVPSTWHELHASNGIPNGARNGKPTNGANGHAKGQPNGTSRRQCRSEQVTIEKPVRVEHHGSEIYLKMHHAVYDGVAVANLLSEMTSLYHGKTLPAAVSFEPFLGEVLAQNTDQALEFWSRRVHDFAPSSFQSQQQGGDDQELSSMSTLDVTRDEVDIFTERNACTSLSLFQAAWTKVLACVQNLTDICFGNVVSGRTVAVPDIERLIAPCFNTIPIRMQVDRLSSNLDLIRALHRENLDVLPFQLASPRRIQAFSREPSRHLFDSLLLVQPPMLESEIDVAEEEEMAMGIPIVLEVKPQQSDYLLNVHHLPERVPTTLVPLLIDAFNAALQSCLRYPSSSVDHFLDFNKSAIAAKLVSRQSEAVVNGVNCDGNEYDDHWTDEEDLVRRVFARLAQVEPSKIQKDTSLYRIGLDSLNAVQVASKLRREGYKVDAADVMQHQTPAAIAHNMCSSPKEDRTIVDLAAFDQSHRATVLKQHDINADALERIRQATPLQSGMLAQFLQSGGKHYLNHSVYAVPPGHSIEDIRNAWSSLERKHQVLRMGFCQLQDAMAPFAMLIYKPGVHLRRVFVRDDGVNSDNTSKRAEQDIFANMHLPVWRVAFFQSEEGIHMQLSLHHALYDADSLNLLMTDFAKALQDEELGATHDIDTVVAAQLEGASGDKTEHKKFWQTSLESATIARFPCLTPTLVTSSKAGSITVTSQMDATKLDAFCKQKGVTIQAVGQSIWALLLAAYVGEPAVTFGTVFSSFTDSLAQDVTFPAIATVPVPCNTSKPALDVVRDMVAYNAAVQRHRYTPLTDIQRYAGSAGRALFDTIFVYQKSIDTEDAFNWHLVSGMLGVDYLASMELEVPSHGTARLSLTYDQSIIPDSHAALMLKQYDFTLGKIINGGAEGSMKALELMSYTPPKISEIPCSVKLLHEFVELGAKTHPDKLALEFVDSFDHGNQSRRRWTYKQLDQRSNQVAHMISQRGISPGNVVAVCMSKSPEASFAFIGILKAGCAFLAMDPDLPVARRKFIMEDSRSKSLFVTPDRTDDEMRAVVDVFELTEKVLEGLPQNKLEIPPTDPNVRSYCLYTSGTTGMPKGCELTHENGVQAMMAFQRLFAGHWDHNSRWLQFASYWFDVSVLEQFWSWSVGIAVVGAPRDLVLEDLPGFIREANITHIDLTPSLARLLKPEEVPSLHNHVFITGGEALKQEIIDAWGPYKTICNGYGPTEATIGVTMNPFVGTDARPSNIGPAFDNVGAYVFKPGTDEMVLRGAVGELCVSGKLVGKGYLNRPDLTAKAFPYLERYGERVYRTGDLVRLLADGSVSFLGRADTQAKLRGQRLEIDEIDAVIKGSDSSITDVASLVIKSNEGNREMLASFIVDSETRRRDVEVVFSDRSRELVHTVNAECQSKLPGYMVPTHIVPLTALPLTVNNKVDTKRLVALFNSMTMTDLQKLKQVQSEDRQATQNERKIIDILSRLLRIGRDDISHNSNIFSLGLSSVSAINFATMLKRNGFQGASVVATMKNPTIDRLAKALSNNESAKKEQNAVKQAQLYMSAFAQRYRNTVAQSLFTEPGTIEVVAPCTPLQTGLLTESLKSTSRPYFNHFWYRVADVNAQKLETAVKKLFRSTPILRTLFVRTDEGFAQVLTTKPKCPVSVQAVEANQVELTLKERKARWISNVDADVLRPFEAIIVQSEDAIELAMHVHHAIYDGISWDLTMQRLVELYKSSMPIEPSQAFVDVLPYGPLCRQPGAEEFWKSQLQHVPFVPLSLGDESSFCGDIFVEASLSNTQTLDAVRRKLGISHQALFQSAFMVALQQHSQQTRTLGMVLSGRSISVEKADQIIGPMFNTVPVTIDRQTADDWATLLQRCHKANAAMLAFQHTALRDIRKYCGRHPSDPMFDVLFVFQQSTTTEAVDRMFKSIKSEMSAEYPLAFEVDMSDSGEVSITVASQSASQPALQALICTFQSALDNIGRDAHQKIYEHFDTPSAGTAAGVTERSQDAPELNGVHDFEWTKESQLLRQSIAEIVGCNLNDVDEHSSIFTLGLDSIDAVKLASRLKRAGIALPVSKILQAQTIPRMLQAAQETKQAASQEVKTSKLADLESALRGLNLSDTADVERVLPATPGQEALLVEMIRSDFHEYYNSDVLRLRSDIDLEKLKNAWQVVVDATPILRTSFVEVSDPDVDVAFAQVVHRPSALQFTHVRAEQVSELGNYYGQVHDDVQRTIADKSPLRLAIASTPTDRYLIVSLAHAQYDGHSIALLHQDVATVYEGSTINRPSYDEAIDLALNATGKDALAYWRSALTGVRPTRVAESKKINTSDTQRAERECSTTATRLQAVCRQLGVSMQAAAQAGWALVLASHARELEVVFGTVLACRESDEAAATMFPTMNTVPIRTALHGTGRDFVQYVQSIINDMRPYQRTPLRAIQSVDDSVTRAGLFDSLFIFQQQSDALQAKAKPLYESVDGDSSVEYPVAAEIEVIGERLIVRIASKLGHEETDRILDDFDKALAYLIDHPLSPIVEFSDGQAVICDLPPFPLQDDQLSRQTTKVDVSDDSADDSDDNAELTLVIRETLARVAKVDVEEVLPSTSIDSLGIDSITAIKVSALLRKEFVKLSVSALLKAQTPRRMAESATSTQSQTPLYSSKEVIDDLLKQVNIGELLKNAGLDSSDVEQVLPASAGQQYMLSMWNRSAGELFFPTFTYFLRTERTAEELREAWHRLVSTSPVLRTIFCYSRNLSVPMLQVILKDVPESFHEGSEASDHMEVQPFVRLHVQRAEDGFNLKLQIHHALYDAVSLPLIMRDFETLLHQGQLPESRPKFEDFLALSSTSAAAKSRESFWKNYLRGARPMYLRQPKTNATKKVELFRPSLSSSVSAFEERARASRVTVQALLFAIQAKLYTQQAVESDAKDVVLGVYLANRSHIADLDNVRAPTLNLLPLLVRAPASTSVLELAQQIDKDLRIIGTAENSSASLEDIFQWTGVKVDCFVNFLKLPESSQDATSNESITQVDDAWQQDHTALVDYNQSDDFTLPRELSGMPLSGAYQHAVDIEISVSGDRISMGVFCLEDMLGLEEAKDLIMQTEKELEEFCSGDA